MATAGFARRQLGETIGGKPRVQGAREDEPASADFQIFLITLSPAAGPPRPLPARNHDVRHPRHWFLRPRDTVLGSLVRHLLEDDCQTRRDGSKAPEFFIDGHSFTGATVHHNSRLTVSPSPRSEPPRPLDRTHSPSWHCSKRFLAAAIHKKINVYDIPSSSSSPVRSSFILRVCSSNIATAPVQYV